MKPGLLFIRRARNNFSLRLRVIKSKPIPTVVWCRDHCDLNSDISVLQGCDVAFCSTRTETSAAPLRKPTKSNFLYVLRAKARVQLSIPATKIIIISEFLTSQLWLGNIHLSWDVVISRIRLGGLICSLKSFLQLNMCQELQIFAAVYMYWGAG